MRDKAGYVYIMANKTKTTFYVGVTSDLIRRVSQHKSRETSGFTSRYNVKSLVYYECFDDVTSAITREKNLKNWQRAWKVGLVIEFNPDWRDLYGDILGLNSARPDSSETPDQVRSDGVF